MTLPTTILGLPLIKGQSKFHYIMMYMDSVGDIFDCEMLLPIGARFYHQSGIFEVIEYNCNEAGEINTILCYDIMDWKEINKIHAYLENKTPYIHKGKITSNNNAN